MPKNPIVIYDPEENSPLAKKIWALMAPGSFLIEIAKTKEDIYRFSETMSILLLNNSILEDYSNLVCKVVYFAPSVTPENRLNLLKSGIDYVISKEEIDSPSFKPFLLNLKENSTKLLATYQAEQEYLIFREALGFSPDAYIFFDKDKRLIYASSHYRRVYKSFELYQGMHISEAYELMAREQGVYPGDPRYQQMKDFWLSLYGRAEVTLDTGQTLRLIARNLPGDRGTVVTTTNITSDKEQKEALLAKSKELELALEKEQEASNIQKQFIAMVSHEFRTPLTIIDGNAQIIQKRGKEIPAEQLEKRSKTIRSAVSRLISMMQGVLSSNMLKTGYLEPEIEAFNLKELIKELSTEQADLTPNLIIETDLEKLPEEVFLDRKMMILIISNLLSNAVKFSKENPTIEINGFIRDDLLLLQFNDNGIGIPPEETEKIFDRFYRASNTTGIAGTGIGLSLVKDLVELQGGSITLVSVLGEGTTFYLTFPIRKNL